MSDHTQVGTINARKINEKSTWDAIDSSCVCRSDWKFWLSFEFQWSCVLRLFWDLALIWFAKFLAEFFLLKIAHVLAAVMMMPNTTKRTSPQTPQTGEHHKHHKKDITANTTNRRTPQTPPDPRKIQPDLNCRRRLLHGPGAATRRRGGASGSNRGPATTSWASRAVAEIRQRHRGPVRLHKNLTKASGTGEIAQPGEHHSQESSRFLSVNSRFP